ncbi:MULTISPECIES: hypothetical protein [Pseudomonas]|jgi:hypothetical protein|uniref:hypothetical protein n=1 Tax=Pseudomonas TaxID=286 RepID=UPI0010715095|nr:MULTISPECIES: hypothetical protein [Pseudomonas]QBR32400.1 hypothetical protein E3Z29_18645 [Pseudomonas sp. S150]UZT90572.1 hypothetical protein OPS05_15715 [Pseudomonas koreensis]
MRTLRLAAYTLFGLACLSSATAAEFDYKRVYQADAGKVGKYIVRYLRTFDSPCIRVQSLVPGGNGEIVKEKELCSVDGKSFLDGYTQVELKKGEFQEDKLTFLFEIMPLEPAPEFLKKCTIPFKDGAPQDLVCETITP